MCIRDSFKVGLVFQYPEYQLFEETVYKDIAFGPKNMGLDAEEIDRRVRDAAATHVRYSSCRLRSRSCAAGSKAAARMPRR